MLTNNSNPPIKRLIFLITIILAVLFSIIFFILRFFLIPEEINIIAGEKELIAFNLPAEAVVLSSDESPLSIEGKPVGSNDRISLLKPFSLSCEKQCSAKVSLRIMGIPIKEVNVSVLPETRLVPCGKIVGVRINTDGIMVLGIGEVKTKDGGKISPCENLLKAGDLIIKADNKPIKNKEELINAIEGCSDGEINILIKRNNEEIEKNIKPAKGEDGKNKIGLWVRDSTQGVGTLTYYNPENMSFGALGHGINDIDTKSLMSVKDGKVMQASVYDIKKGEKGSPGEIIGDIEVKEVIGEIYTNTDYGIYGRLTDMQNQTDKALPIALHSQVKEGAVKILSAIDGNAAKEYDAEIVNINTYNINSPKSMVIRITDKELLEKTNGIVQGMSGSPIIQNGKLIGAVTHVFVNEPNKGYGVFIENMLKNEQTAS